MRSQAPVVCIGLSSSQPAPEGNAVRQTVAAEKQAALASALEGTDSAGLTGALFSAGRQVG